MKHLKSTFLVLAVCGSTYSLADVCRDDQAEPHYREVGNQCLPSCGAARTDHCQDPNNDCSGTELSRGPNCSENVVIQFLTYERDRCCLTKEPDCSEYESKIAAAKESFHTKVNVYRDEFLAALEIEVQKIHVNYEGNSYLGYSSEDKAIRAFERDADARKDDIKSNFDAHLNYYSGRVREAVQKFYYQRAKVTSTVRCGAH